MEIDEISKILHILQLIKFENKSASVRRITKTDTAYLVSDSLPSHALIVFVIRLH